MLDSVAAETLTVTLVTTEVSDAVIIALPAAAAVTSPLAFTPATAGLPDFQVAVAVISWICRPSKCHWL